MFLMVFVKLERSIKVPSFSFSSIMACNSCSKTFSLLRKEKGCPACGFSYCSNCLKYKLFIPKLNSEAKVCAKCERVTKSSEPTRVEPPDAYYKRISALDSVTTTNSNTLQPGASSSKDQEILDRLVKLKEDANNKNKQVTTEDIANRLQKIKGEPPTTSDADLQLRLANIRGVPVSTLQSKPIAIVPDTRSEQEQAEDLLKQYMEQTKIDSNYKDEFEGVIDDIQSRLQKLKSQSGSVAKTESNAPENIDESEDEEEILRKIIEKAKIESRLESEIDDPVLEELPFCEICNEDAVMRCLGCKYLFCKRCFMEHKDDDDGCNKYELYRPAKKC